MLGYYNYTVYATYLGLISGVLGICFAAKDKPVIAVVCLLVCGLIDSFDGAIARTKKNRTDSEKKFGIQIDSLSDLVCFGVLPTAIGFSIGMTEWYFMVILCMYALCGLIRLAYFNVTEEERCETTNEKRKYYEGLPITNASLLLSCFFAFSFLFGKDHTNNIFMYCFAGLMFIISILFVVGIKIPKGGKKTVTALAIIGSAIFIFMLINIMNLWNYWK